MNKIFSQNYSAANWEEIIWQERSNENAEKENEEINYEEELEQYRENPININTITKDQLEVFPFLTDLQIEHLLLYLYISGPMKTLYELQLIEDMDRQTIQYLLPFIYIGKVEKSVNIPSFKQLLKSGKQEIIIRSDFPLNKKDGYRNYSDSILQLYPNRHYLGSKFYHSLKYSYHYKDRLYIGLSAEKDRGEPFFCKGNKKGYDYYSFYLYVHNLGNLKALAIGNYRLSFSQGLVMSTDYNMGKSASISTIGYKQEGIKKHSSTDEYNYFRGIAGSYQIKKWILSGFCSYRKLDAIVENRLITSLKKDGMHRLEREFEKKNRVSNYLIGSNITYKSPVFQLVLTTVYNIFNKELKPVLKPYSIFYPQGKEFFNISIGYKYYWNKLYFFGETAMDKNGRLATLNVLRFAPLTGYQFILLQRFYARDYQTLYGRSISEGGGVRNEEGFYLGTEIKPIKYWKLFAYADFFRFPWLKYGIDKPSSGFDGLIQLTYTPKSNLIMFVRYRYKIKDKNYRITSDPEININEEKGEKENKRRDEEQNSSNLNDKKVLSYIHHTFRLQINYLPQENFSLGTTLQLTSICPEGISASFGFMLFISGSYSFQHLPLKVDVNYGFFDTDDYESRLSIYEKGILYAFSFPSFFGKGAHAALNIRYDFNKKLTGLVKISRTKYMDREEIGTSLEKIEGNTKADLYLQLRWKF